MTTPPLPSLARVASVLALAAGAALTGCATTTPPTAAGAAPETRPPAAQPIGDFASGLRCMDGLLHDYGTRDLSVIVEDLADQTQRVKVGSRDILVAVVSDMTQRSRAIRLVASGKDWGNTTTHMTQALKREPFAVVPQYALRGSITQLDATLSVDLTMLTTHDLSVVPGIATRNSIVLSRDGRGFGSRAEIRKFGTSYTLDIGRTDGPTQAARAVVELAAIEVFGRLARVPYWTCLGIGDSNAAVAGEIQDWYDAMAARPAEIIRYYQSQMRTRRVYDGPIDGTVNPQLKEAVARYREALGLSREPKLSLDFFKAYLGADHAQVATRLAATAVAVAPAAPAATQPVVLPPITSTAGATESVPAGAPVVGAAPSPRPAPASERVRLVLNISAANEARRFARGEPVQLTIRPSRDAHVYCFLQDENRKIMRFFPNRFQRDSRVLPAEGLRLPGAQRFQIVMNPRGLQETVACFATERDVLAQLPAALGASDFDPLPVASLDQVRSAFAKAAGGALAQESFVLQAK